MRHSLSGSRKGFTLVELLVVISIIGLLVALLLPSLSAARQSAIAAGANTTLNGFGRSTLITADQDAVERGRLCSGAYDHLRDGDTRRVGWVADVVKNKVINPTKALDASNPSKLNEKLLDFVGATNRTGRAYARVWGGTTGTKDNVFYGGANGPADDNQASPKTAGERREELWDGGYNTNFATSWVFVRGDQLQGTGTPAALSNNVGTTDGSKGPMDGEGPLSESKLMSCKASREVIPLIANARNGDGSDATITNDIASSVNNFFGFTGTDPEFVKGGTFAVESFCDGKDCKTYSAAVAQGLNLRLSSTSAYADVSETTTHALALHELNDFYPVVGARKNGDGMFVGGSVQILFADGHVAKIKDSAGFQSGPDGWIGPFKVGGWANASNSSAAYELNASNLAEIRPIWLKDLGSADAAGAGGSFSE